MPSLLRKPFALKITVYAFLFPFLYFILPIILTKCIGGQQFKFIFVFYVINTAIIFFLLQINSSKAYTLDSSVQEIQERFNLKKVEFLRESKSNISLKEKNRRYSSLKIVLEEISQSLDLDEVADALSTESFSLIAKNRGSCALYLIDSQAQKLSLFKAKKEDPRLVMKAKEGNIFDFWVLRHSSPLLIEDIKNDFRFDLEKLELQDSRPVASLICAPFISENKFIGLIRLDNQTTHFYNQDDLRFLVYISDLGAVALENCELFKRTQDLAIHDSLTSLYTKGYFAERLKEEWKRCLRQNIPLSLFMLDIDFFKNYNDKFGHTAGDIVLRKVSHILTTSLANFNPIISRFGGEEFCVMASGLDKNGAFSVAQGLRQAIEKEKIILGLESHITVSIGIANYPADISDGEELIRRADQAMYQAKQKGRNQVCCI